MNTITRLLRVMGYARADQVILAGTKEITLRPPGIQRIEMDGGALVARDGVLSWIDAAGSETRIAPPPREDGA